ncbi:alpha-defensin 9-like [Peromyscus californicus insignis]|uniref:alpha-defensin 9-like n=1 Tax=Peromyscus californicus insignis TaxID=564181 RepID=UPI0022A6D1C6|nr:alpha-defensin 9-like [Peromyscus californicus insignis]
MKTLVLLSALILLVFLTQIDAFPEASEGDKNEEQAGVEDQDVSISFGGPVGDALQDAAARKVKCHCRKNGCRRSEQVSGTCNKGPVRYVFCCR